MAEVHRSGTGAERLTARPHARPPIRFRAVAGVIGLALALFNIALMFSDRAPSLLASIFGEPVRRIWHGLGIYERTGVLPDSELPGADAVAHIVVWGGALILVGLAVWTWRGLGVGAVAILAFSSLVEVGQGIYSSSRSVTVSDAMANAFGVLFGVIVVAFVYVGWSTVSALTPGRHRRAVSP